MIVLTQLLKKRSHQTYRLYNSSCRSRNYNYDWLSSSSRGLLQTAHRQLHRLIHWLYQQLRKWVRSLIPSLKSTHHNPSQQRRHHLHSIHSTLQSHTCTTPHTITQKATKSGQNRPHHHPCSPRFHHRACLHMLNLTLINILPHLHHQLKRPDFSRSSKDHPICSTAA